MYTGRITIGKEIDSKIYTEMLLMEIDSGTDINKYWAASDEDQALNPRSRELQGLAGMVGQACIAASSICPI